jgi:hypothetical protein
MHTLNVVNPRQERLARPGAGALAPSQWALVCGTWVFMMLIMTFLMLWAGR